MSIGKIAPDVIGRVVDKSGEVVSEIADNLPKHCSDFQSVPSDKILSNMDCASYANRALVKKPELSDAQKQLRERLEKLNIQTAPRRECFENDLRFGDEGISSIMKNATSTENIQKIHSQLDRLEQGEEVWTYDIVKIFTGESESMPTVKNTVKPSVPQISPEIPSPIES